MIVIIVKQGEGTIQTDDKNTIMSRLLELGGRAPFFSGPRGSYILLGYRLQRGDTIPWITQVAKVEAGGVSYLKKVITLKCKLFFSDLHIWGVPGRTRAYSGIWAWGGSKLLKTKY